MRVGCAVTQNHGHDHRGSVRPSDPNTQGHIWGVSAKIHKTRTRVPSDTWGTTRERLQGGVKSNVPAMSNQTLKPRLGLGDVLQVQRDAALGAARVEVGLVDL